MRSAAACTVLFVLVLGVFSAGAAAAGPLDPATSSLTGDVQNQVGSVVNDPVGTATGATSNVTGTVSGTVDTVSGTADAATGGATAPVSGAVNGTVNGATGSATDAVDSVAGSVSGTAGASGSSGSGIVGSSGSGTGILGSGTTSSTSSSRGSGSASAGRSTARTRDATNRGSNPGSPRTAFNRLPRRYEALLERIEAGHHVRASIARLRELLASASPQLRARILRLIGVEIRRLERGGVTPRERAMLERLRMLRSAFAPNVAPQVGQSPLPLPGGSSVATSAGPVGVGTNAAFGNSERPARSDDSGGGSGGSGLIALPSVPGPPYLLMFLLGTLACGLLIALAASRRLPAHVRAVLAAHGGPQLSAFAATVGLIIAVAVGFMIQAFLP